MWRQNISTSVRIGLSLLTAAVVNCCFCYCVYVGIKQFFILFFAFLSCTFDSGAGPGYVLRLLPPTTLFL